MKDVPGVTPRSNSILKTILQQQLPPQAKVVLYGSRAKGRYQNGSDIDLAIKNLPEGTDLCWLRYALDDSIIPYMFDITDYDRITYQPFRDEIDRYGIPLN